MILKISKIFTTTFYVLQIFPILICLLNSFSDLWIKISIDSYLIFHNQHIFSLNNTREEYLSFWNNKPEFRNLLSPIYFCWSFSKINTNWSNPLMKFLWFFCFCLLINIYCVLNWDFINWKWDLKTVILLVINYLCVY